jgi:hypothetical protein
MQEKGLASPIDNDITEKFSERNSFAKEFHRRLATWEMEFLRQVT